MTIGAALAASAPAQESQPQPEPTPSEGTSRIEVVNEGSSEISDEEVVVGIKKALEDDKHVPSYQIGIGAENGDVTLSGTVSNILAKERAAALAKTVTGVQAVNNTINVAVPPRQDWEIKTDVLTSFRNNPTLESYQLDAPVRDGFVILSGVVDSPQRKQLAELLTKAVPGVRGVENQIDVSFGTERPDPEILADVLSQISWDPWLLNPQLVVKVNDGVVTMSGFVTSQTAREHAIKAAWVTGTTGVNAQNLRVTESIQAAFMPPEAPPEATKASPEMDDLDVQAGPLPDQSATSAPEIAIAATNTVVTRTNVPEAVGGATIQDEPPLSQTNPSGLGEVLQNQTQTLTSLETVVNAETPQRFAGQRAHFMDATVRAVIGDRILMLGTDPGGPLLPVRLQEVHPEIRAGQTVEVTGIITQMPQYLRWWELNEQQEAHVRKAPVFLNALNVRVRQAPGQSAPTPNTPAPRR